MISTKGKETPQTRKGYTMKNCYDIYYWDNEDEQGYISRQVSMTPEELDAYLDNLNKDETDGEYYAWLA